MYFLVDIALIAIFAAVVVVSVKFGFSRNFVFGIVRFLLALAGGAGLAVGVFLLFDKLGWLDSMKLLVTRIFGDTSALAYFLSDENVALIGKIVSFLPLGIILVIGGYIFAFWFFGFICKLIFKPLFDARKKGGKVKIIDNVLGFILNFALAAAVVLCVFASVHAFNEGDRYKNASGAEDPEHPSFGQQIVNDISEPVLSNLNESFTASPIGYLVYNYNPLNGLFSGIINK